jgi:hypothetical protein
MDNIGLPFYLIPFALLGMLPYVLGIWAVVMLVQILRANREIAARLAAIENALKQK